MWHAPRSSLQAAVGCVLYAESDPHGGTGSLVFGTPQAQRRRLRVAGPLDDECARLAALLHIVWLLRMPAGAHVLAAQAFRTCSTDKPGGAHGDAAAIHRRRRAQAGVADLKFELQFARRTACRVTMFSPAGGRDRCAWVWGSGPARACPRPPLRTCSIWSPPTSPGGSAIVLKGVRLVRSRRFPARQLGGKQL